METGQTEELETAEETVPEEDAETHDAGGDGTGDVGDAPTGDATSTAEASATSTSDVQVPPPACTVSGRAVIRDLNVAIEGERRPRQFASVAGVFDATLPERRTSATHVVVREPLAFAGDTRAPIPYAIARPVDLADSALHIAPATPLARVVLDGGDARVDVDLADGVSVTDLPVACNLLTLHMTAPATPSTASEDGLLSRSAQLRLFTSPNAETPAVTVRLRRPTDIVLTETARRDGWVRVWRSFDTGASFVGWVPERAVRAFTAPTTARVRAVREPREVRERVPPPCETPSAGFYLGPARVTPNTEVRTAADGVVWAHTAVRDVTVLTMTDPAWVSIVAIDGIASAGRCPAHLDAAIISRASVTFPSAARLPGAMHEAGMQN